MEPVPTRRQRQQLARETAVIVCIALGFIVFLIYRARGILL